MLNIVLDFSCIADRADFWRQFSEKCALESWFGANNDALWDVLTGEIPLPARIELRHWQQHAFPEQFADIVAVMLDAEEELDGELQIVILS